MLIMDLLGGKALAHPDLPPTSHTTVNERSPSTQENDGHEEEQVQQRTNHWFLATGRSRHGHSRVVPCGGFSQATFYKWRAKFGGMQVSEAQRLRELESENAKLKKLLAEAHLDIHALKSVFGVKR